MMRDNALTTDDQSEATSQHQQIPPWVLDLLLGIAVTSVIALVISAEYGGQQGPDLLAYLFAGGFGALMLVRRRFPVAVLVVTMFLLFVYYTLGYPAIGLAVPVAAALYSAAEQGRGAAAVVVSLLLIIVSTYFRLDEVESLAYLLIYELVSTVALMAAAIALGDGARTRRALRIQQEQTARLLEQEHALRAEQRMQAERVRMARDLHDMIGHSVTVITLHADVAREAIGNNDAQARQALAQIRTTGSETLRELRATVKLLRNPASEQPDQAITSLANLRPLVENAKTSGLTPHVQIDGDLGRLSATVHAAAYRIIQEALTNVIRHANATEVTVAIRVNAETLRLQVIDNGATFAGSVTPGSGITGMIERARLLGGALTAQAQPGGGFAVVAEFSLEDNHDISSAR